MNQLLKNKVLDDKDRKHIQTSSEMFSVMSEKYKKVLDKQKHENEKINVFNTYIRNYKTKYNRKISDEQAFFSDYVEQKQAAIESMTELLDAQKELELFESRISETKIIPESNSVDKYRFISKLQIEKIDNNYIADVIKSVIKRGKVINTKESG